MSGNENTAGGRVVLVIGPGGIESVRAVGQTDEETARAEALIERIAPGIDLIETIVPRPFLVDPVEGVESVETI